MMAGLLKPMHLLVLLVIVLFIFGPSRLPELGSSIAKAIRGFKKSVDENEPTPEDTLDIKKIEKR